MNRIVLHAQLKHFRVRYLCTDNDHVRHF